MVRMPPTLRTVRTPWPPRRSHCHRQQRSRRRQRRSISAAYRVSVSLPPEIGRVRFSRVIARVLNDARDRGMSDTDIHEATSISPSTFHRWRRGDSMPDIRKITAFCEGLGVPPTVALRALGLEKGRDDPEPEPAMDPHIRRILRGLADPNVSDFDKSFVRETLKMLATRVTQGRHS
jgi:transcriptional regulator with XRE-family HTH domain